MASIPKTLITPAEYLAIERKAQVRSEYINGEMVAMTGATRNHNLITINLAREISQQLKGKSCEAYPVDMRVRIPSSDIYTYPDLVAVCGEPDFEDDTFDTLTNPTLIIEVLSDSTESYDRGMKSKYYRRIPSLEEYVLVAQDEYMVEQHVRQPGGRWLISESRSIRDRIVLACIGCALSLEEVYDKVKLP